MHGCATRIHPCKEAADVFSVSQAQHPPPHRNFSRYFSSTHIAQSKMILRDTVGDAKSHSLELTTLFLDVLEGRTNIVAAEANFGRKKTMTQIGTLLVDSGKECDKQE